VVLLSACGTDPAPAELDGLFGWLWSRYDVASAKDLLDANTKLQAATSDAQKDKPLRGKLSALTEEQLKDVDVNSAQLGQSDRSLVHGAAISKQDEVGCAPIEQNAIKEQRPAAHQSPIIDAVTGPVVPVAARKVNAADGRATFRQPVRQQPKERPRGTLQE
jgi:hypothetical protein